MQLDTNVLGFLRKVMNVINPMNLAQLKTATGRDQLSKLLCQVNTMLLSTEKILLEHLPGTDSSNKT